MATNGQASKDLGPILKASAAVKDAEAALETARQALNTAGAQFLAKHGKTIERKTGKGDARHSYTVKAIDPIAEGGQLFEVTQRENGTTVVKVRNLAG